MTTLGVDGKRIPKIDPDICRKGNNIHLLLFFDDIKHWTKLCYEDRKPVSFAPKDFKSLLGI